ncbi:TauD/TfdA dioxygenase family protein [Actinokineospora soli]|uniref:TauD/TfdA dioxygenase family protein n=1 Tax=Actinokineospora soli TaxID=1048753 RepID=A0ABW2TNZ2_9PSEU
MGAVVRDAELSGGIGADDLARVWAALDEHLVLVFRGHRDPTDEELLAFGRNFGHIPRTGLTAGANPDHNEILIISNVVRDGEKIGVGDANWMDWHTDYSFRPAVSQIGVLAAVELPPSGGGETVFTDMYSTFESLPDNLRARLLTYRARHALRSGYEEVIVDELQGEITIDPDEPLISPDGGTATIHPVVARNPRTGRRSLYVNPLNTKQILELDQADSDKLLAELFATAGAPEFTYAHPWEPGDIVLWDQLGLVHARKPFDPAERRILRKVVTIFDDPVAPWRPAA